MFNMMPTGGEGYMLGGYATSRYGEEAFEHFEQRHHGHTSILSVCYYLAFSISCLWNFQRRENSP